jgi:hypothetical protein
MLVLIRSVTLRPIHLLTYWQLTAVPIGGITCQIRRGLTKPSSTLPLGDGLNAPGGCRTPKKDLVE